MSNRDILQKIAQLESEVEKLKKEIGEQKTLSFSKIDFDELDELFQIERDYSFQLFQLWFSESREIQLERDEKLFLEELLKKEGRFLLDYLEEDLKANFIIPILNRVDFRVQERGVRGFYEQKLSYSNSRGGVKGTVDFVVAYGRKRAKVPLFFIQEFKQESEASDPEPQLIGEMIAGLEISKLDSIKGAFIRGKDWFFVVLEKLGEDSYRYSISDELNSRKIADLEAIYRNLLSVKREILNTFKEK
jgi:hypothetical protein